MLAFCVVFLLVAALMMRKFGLLVYIHHLEVCITRVLTLHTHASPPPPPQFYFSSPFSQSGTKKAEGPAPVAAATSPPLQDLRFAPRRPTLEMVGQTSVKGKLKDFREEREERGGWKKEKNNRD